MLSYRDEYRLILHNGTANAPTTDDDDEDLFPSDDDSLLYRDEYRLILHQQAAVAPLRSPSDYEDDDRLSSLLLFVLCLYFYVVRSQ